MIDITSLCTSQRYDNVVPCKSVKVNGGDVKHLFVAHESDVFEVRLEGPHSLLLQVIVLAEDNLHLNIGSLQLGRVNTAKYNDQ